MTVDNKTRICSPPFDNFWKGLHFKKGEIHLNGRRALYAGAHAGHIVDWPEATGKTLLFELMWRADQPEFRLSHAWREGDVVVWDNRAVVHRATYYDPVKHKRFMQRTTIGGDELTVPQ